MLEYLFNLFLYVEKDPDEIKKALEEILNRPEFGGIDSGRITFFGKIMREIGEWEITRKLVEALETFLKFLFEVLSNPGTYLAFNVVVYILFGLLVAFIVFNVIRRISPEVSEKEKSKVEKILSPPSREALARKCADNGDFETAIRHLYLSLLQILRSHSLVDFSRSRTNRELEKFIQSSSPGNFAQNFSHLNKIFEQKVYALEQCSQKDYEEFFRRYQLCKREAGKVG